MPDPESWDERCWIMCPYDRRTSICTLIRYHQGPHQNWGTMNGHPVKIFEWWPVPDEIRVP